MGQESLPGRVVVRIRKHTESESTSADGGVRVLGMAFVIGHHVSTFRGACFKCLGEVLVKRI